MASLFRVVFLGFIASFFILGIYKVFTNFEENGCEMTYMYQLPEYLVSMDHPLEPFPDRGEARFFNSDVDL